MCSYLLAPPLTNAFTSPPRRLRACITSAAVAAAAAAGVGIGCRSAWALRGFQLRAVIACVCSRDSNS